MIGIAPQGTKVVATSTPRHESGVTKDKKGICRREFEPSEDIFSNSNLSTYQHCLHKAPRIY